MAPITQRRKEALAVYAWTASSTCCKRSCHTKFTESDVRTWREFYHGLTQSVQREMLASHLHLHSIDDEVHRTFFLMPSGSEAEISPSPGVSAVRVCMRFFLHFFFISRNKIYRHRVTQGRFSGVVRAFRDFDCDKRRKCVVWLCNLAKYYLISSNSGKVHLPGPTRRCIFRWFVDDMQQRGEINIPSRSTFMKAWKSPACSHITLRRWLPFAQCTTCVSLSDRFRDHHRTPSDEREVVAGELKSHHEYIKQLRDLYAIRCDLARTDPTTYLSISIDAADQAAYGIPYFHRRSHVDQAMTKVGVHLMGAIVHGRRPYAFTFLENIKHGTNVTIECLHRIFRHVRETEGALPKILQLQMDNTCKQNKNKYMLGWMFHLVSIGTFDEVRLNFFPVGHTHADVDQMFSRLAVHLMGVDSKSRAGLLRCLREGFSMSNGGSVHGEHLDRAANISHFLEPLLESKLEGVTNYQMFKISKSDARTVLEAYVTELSEFSEGLTQNWSLFALDVPPLNARTVPASQRRTKTAVELNAIRKGLERAVKLRNFEPAEIQDINDCIAILGDDTPLEFDWDMDVYAPSTKYPRRLPERVQMGHGWNIGDICLVRPAEDIINDEHFWIAQILSFTSIGHHPAAVVHWWENQSAHARFDELKGVFAADTSVQDTIFIGSMYDKITFTKQDFRLTSTSKHKVAHHVKSWIGEGAHSLLMTAS